jgi:hypothetical protein
MKVIASTSTGFLIEATKDEVNEILMAVNGSIPEKINIGQKLPALDYAATIRKLKKLPDDHNYEYLITYASNFNEYLEGMKKAVQQASTIDFER